MAVVIGMAVNIALGIVKIVTGTVGNSYALIADCIEHAEAQAESRQKLCSFLTRLARCVA